MIREPSRELILQTNGWRFIQRVGLHSLEAILQFSPSPPYRQTLDAGPHQGLKRDAEWVDGRVLEPERRERSRAS